MKKILFGLCALALSATAFGAISTDIDTDGKTQVMLPMEVRANVVNGTDRLFIEGESGNTFGDVLKLNIGDMVKGGPKGEASGKVRVYRGDENGVVPAAFGGTLTVSLVIEGTPTQITQGLAKQLELKNTSPNAQETLNSNLTVGYAHFNNTDPEQATNYETQIIATIDPIGDGQTEGSYLGTANIVAELDLNI